VIEVAASGVYPVRVDASLDAPLSRWLWLVKWLLLVPHFIVLGLLWITFVVLSVVAFFAILFTGAYPRPVFEFNVGVLRWTWRVQYYAIGAFGTDRYPPFTLADDPSYPAHLEVEYPRRLSRGLALVKWWLLAIPHYIIVAVFTGGGLWAAWRAGNDNASGNWPGLIAILAVVAAVVLLFTGRYPQQIFDFVLGMNRWVLRVAAYAGLMTDAYPPFRLDMGGHDPATMALPQLPAPGPGPAGTAEQPGQPDGPRQAFTGGEGTTPAGAPGGSQAGPQTGTAGPAGAAPGGQPSGWTAGRIVAVVAGAVLVLCSLGLLGAGGAALWAHTAARQGGYVDLGSATYATSGYAVASDPVKLHAAGGGWDAAQALFGTVRIRATSTAGAAPVFIGIAPAGAASTYLAGVAHATIYGPAGSRGWLTEHAGTAPAIVPSRASLWDAHATGPGAQTVVWPVRSGDWTVVAMNANGSRPVSVHLDVAATLPALSWIAGGLLAGGVIILTAGVLLLVIPIRHASRQPAVPRR
jgi:Domain of unknown function (DUF4389)